MNITGTAIANNISNIENVCDGKIIDIAEKVLIEQNEKLNVEFENLQRKIIAEKALDSTNTNLTKKTEEGNMYHGPRQYYGLETMIEFCKYGLKIPVTKLEKLYLDKLYLYIECASKNGTLGRLKKKNILYSETTKKRKEAEEKRSTKESKKLIEQLDNAIDEITFDDIIEIDQDIYYYGSSQMAPTFRMLISEIIELIEYSEIDELIVKDKHDRCYFTIDDNLEEAFFCLKKLAFIMKAAIEYNEAESSVERNKRLGKQKTLN